MKVTDVKHNAKFPEEKVSFWLTKSLAGDSRDLLCKNFSVSMAVDQVKILPRPNFDVLPKSVIGLGQRNAKIYFETLTSGRELPRCQVS